MDGKMKKKEDGESTKNAPAAADAFSGNGRYK